MIRCDVDGAVARVVLDRSEAKNALTAELRDELADLFLELSGDLRVRAVTLTGAGDAFCTGADLRGGQRRAPRPTGAPDVAPGEVARLVQRGWQRLITAVLDCEKPVIAAVNGTAAGAGVHLALACDLVVAADSARFIEVFVRRGIIPDGAGVYLVTRLVGPQLAKELMFFGDDLAAPRAAEIGLINRVVAAEDLQSVADEWADRLAAGPTRALAVTKALINRAYESDRGTALADEAAGQELVQATQDADEGVRAFLERRRPDFTGW